MDDDREIRARTGQRKGTLEERKLATGEVVFRGRLRLADGTKSPRIPAPAGMTREQAVRWLAGEQAKEDTDHLVLKALAERSRKRAASKLEASPGETCDDWHRRFLASRTHNTRNAEGRWSKWISPTLGPIAIKDVTREHIEKVRDALDAAQHHFAATGRGPQALMPKTAANVWSVLTTAMKHACASKIRSLRVRSDNPCIGVLPPDRGDSRRKTFLYPNEALALLSSTAVPLEWRRIYALSLYTYLRPGELAELRWKDIDQNAKILTVSRAWDWVERKAKTPKTQNGVRRVPIRPELLPLLALLSTGKRPEDLVSPLLAGKNTKNLGEQFRTHLRAAAITDPRLLVSTRTHVPVNFRSCRDSGITWEALVGTDLAKIQRRAGHDDINTTLGYVKAAEDFSNGSIGTPFPPLPEALWSTAWTTSGGGGGNRRESKCTGRDLNADDLHVSSTDREPSRNPATEIPPRNTTDAEGTGPTFGPPNEGDEGLIFALTEAAKSGRFDVVVQLAKELEARRLERQEKG